MSFAWNELRVELKPMWRLALPVVVGELGWMSMGVVDVMMVGRLSAEAIGGVSLGRALFIWLGVLGMGLLLGLDTLISQAFGAGRIDDCRRWLIHGVYLSVGMALPMTAIYLVAIPWLGTWDIDPAVRTQATAYMGAVIWSVLPFYLFFSFRRYLQAMNLVRPVMLALISANLVNVATNWILIFGNLGAPELGVAGAGWATAISSSYLASFLLVTTLLHDREQGRRLFELSWRLDWGRMRRLLALGSPASVTLGLEIGVFTLATALASRLDAASLAAHQIALVLASVTYMVPMGISSAGAVRVGQALGRKEPAAAARAGWTALMLGAGFMSLAALTFILLPRPLVRLFSSDVDVIGVGATLLVVAAFFQLFDGIQVVCTGGLRGAGDTRTPMVWNLVGHWLVGLPIGYVFCFRLGYGVVGLWIGLSAGLILVGAVLLWKWWRMAHAFRFEPAQAPQ